MASAAYLSPLSPTSLSKDALAAQRVPGSLLRQASVSRTRTASAPSVQTRTVQNARQQTVCSLGTYGGLGNTRMPDQFLELTSQEELDEVLKDASEKKQLVLVEWMAQWCRKCIYLKPKIEKLVNEYPNVRCCVVDVNKVPYTFVKSANISKMPTLQLWEKGVQVEELVGGEAAWQVLDKVREMIKRHQGF